MKLEMLVFYICRLPFTKIVTAISREILNSNIMCTASKKVQLHLLKKEINQLHFIYQTDMATSKGQLLGNSVENEEPIQKNWPGISPL